MLPVLRRWLPAVLWMVLIYLVFSQSRLPLDGTPWRQPFHVLIHTVEYAGLALCLVHAQGRTQRRLGLAFVLTVLTP
jgi:hypothetical protein